MAINRLHNNKNRGAAFLLFILFFLFASGTLTFLISKSIYGDLIAYKLLTNSKAGYFVAEASVEDVAYRYIAGGFEVDETEALTIDDATAETITAIDYDAGVFVLESMGDRADAVRKVSVELLIGAGASFNFGLQAGNGGFSMVNSSVVIGNVFSNGNIEGQGTSEIQGDVIAAGYGNTADGIHATGSVRADNIINSTIDENSYYNTDFLNNSYNPGTVFGPGITPEATSSLPFPDDRVADHKASVTAAIADGVGTHILATDPECTSGTYTINTDTTFSVPTKIDCNVVLQKQGSGTTLTLLDTLWVEGNLTFQSGPTVEAAPAMATSSILVIVDNESDRINSSQIVVGQGTDFLAPTSPKSYIMLLSMNDDAENGGYADPDDANDAITMGQSSNGDVIVYAGHGKITLTNQITLKEVTGFLISMGNNTTIEYESGLINLNFTSGPGGGFEVDAWSEIE